MGFILFARNVETPQSVRALCAELRETVDDPYAPILIDQEGGRVRRLRPPYWRDMRPAADFGALYEKDTAAGEEAAKLNARLLADELTDCGINVDCVPLLDVPVPGAHEIIGDRAFSSNTATIAALGRIMSDTLIGNGVLPISKHIPGHGRASADSHLALPRVSESLDILQASDFEPFKALNDIPLGMTAHILYEALDKDHPATQSPAVISGVIRNYMGFDGLLMTDDLSMKALGGSFADRTRLSLEAGCDIVLHCNGNMDEMVEISDALPDMGEAALTRWNRAKRLLEEAKPEPFDREGAMRRLDELFS